MKSEVFVADDFVSVDKGFSNVYDGSIDNSFDGGNFNENGSSSNGGFIVLWITIGVCILLGIVLGIIFGRKSAMK